MAYWKDKRTGKFSRPKQNRSNQRDSGLPSINRASVDVVSDKMSSQAVAIHSKVNSRTSSIYLKDIKDYTDANIDDRTTVVELARKLRSREGVCSSVADLLCDFGVTKGKFSTDNEELQKVLNDWFSTVNTITGLINLKGIILPVPGMRAAIRKIFDSYLTDGDSVFVFNWEKNVKMVPGMSAPSFFLPTSIRVLDTLSLAADEDLAKLGYERLVLNLSREIKDKVKKPVTDADKFLVKTIPDYWKKSINNNTDIVLDPNVSFHLKRNCKDYKAWGESIFIKTFTAIANKRRLQAVDEATIDGMINRFTIFKIGLPDSEKNKVYHIPTPSRVNALISILTDPKRANAIVWPGPDLTVEDIGPDGKILEFVDKYKQADLDVLRALHVPSLLIDGNTSGQSAKDWASFISTEVGLDVVRGELELILTKIGNDIAVANSFTYTQLSFKFDSLLLKDEERVRNFAIKLYELGVISIETFISVMGYDMAAEKFRRQKEQDEGLPELFKNNSLPYQGTETTVDPDGRPKDEDNPKKTVEVQEAKTATFSFESSFSGIFDNMSKDIYSKKDLKDKYAIELSLIGGFSAFNSLLESHLKRIFYNSTNGEDNYELSELLTWNKGYVDNFYSELRGHIVNESLSNEELSALLLTFKRRLATYVVEGEKRALLMAKIYKANKAGHTRCVWETNPGENTCELCFANEGKIFNIADVTAMFPPHLGCNCNLNFID
ncbi:hypothetical protein M0R04_05850 [Candidatus Dojkabacteria bacterium]|jgi:hypothetical protein|nr:hypothetical protein [Candidatus Dojkabacteria bacterium]